MTLPSARALRRGGEVLLFAYLPALALLCVLNMDLVWGKMADFRVFWHAGHDVLAGHPSSFIYPPPVELAVAPLSLLPIQVAAVVWFLLLTGSIYGILRIAGVTDWRCYGITFLASPTLAVLGSGAVGSLLTLGAILAWKRRDESRWSAPVLALTIVAKVFMWPLLVWLVATKRWRSLWLTTASAIALVVVSWSVIGFAGMTSYPSKLHVTALDQERSGFSMLALGLALHLPTSIARALWLVVVALILAGVFAAARGRDGDRRAFQLAILAALAATPISWLHYFVLLVALIALSAPTLTPIWFLPLGFWYCSMGSSGKLTPIIVANVLTIAIAAVTLSNRSVAARLVRRDAAAVAPSTAATG